MTYSNLLMQNQSECLEALKSAAKISNRFKKVLMDTLKLFMAIPGKVNFLQMGRYGEFSEQTYRNNFENEAFDWYAFNEHLVRKVLDGKFLAIAVDPSFLPKSGKKGHPKWYDGKDDFANLPLSRCEEIKVDKGRLFGLKAYSKSLKRFIKVVV